MHVVWSKRGVAVASIPSPLRGGVGVGVNAVLGEFALLYSSRESAAVTPLRLACARHLPRKGGGALVSAQWSARSLFPNAIALAAQRGGSPALPTTNTVFRDGANQSASAHLPAFVSQAKTASA